jgi:transposase
MTQNSLNYNTNDYDIFIGVDVDKKSFSVTFKDQDKMNYSKKMPSEPKLLHNYTENHFKGKKIIYAYEAGPTGWHFHDYMKKKKKDCIVVSPLSLPKAPSDKVKTNRIDSERIAKELKSGNMTPIRVPNQAYRELRYLMRSREDYVSLRVASKQKIKALLLHSNLYKKIRRDDSSWSRKYLDELKTIKCDYGIRNRLDMLLLDLEHSRSQTFLVLRKIKQFLKERKDVELNCAYIRSIPGIGFITAVTLLSRIGDPILLKNVRELGCFVGLVPKEKSTGESIIKSSITHMGDGTLRTLLVEAAWTSIRKDRQLEQFYHRIKMRNHPRMASRKAIVAVARKLTHRIYCVLKKQRNYIVH